MFTVFPTLQALKFPQLFPAVVVQAPNFFPRSLSWETLDGDAHGMPLKCIKIQYAAPVISNAYLAHFDKLALYVCSLPSHEQKKKHALLTTLAVART